MKYQYPLYLLKVLAIAALPFALGMGCLSPQDDCPTHDNNNGTGFLTHSYPSELSSCDFGSADPGRLASVTTDFSTGALSIVDMESLEVSQDIALATRDTLVRSYGGEIYLVNRLGFNSITRLDGETYEVLGEYPISAYGTDQPNPTDVVFSRDGIAAVILFGAPEIQFYDFSLPADEAKIGSVNLSAFADADGNPEITTAIACGQTLFVSAQNLDAEWVPEGTDQVIAIDFEAMLPYPQNLDLLGNWTRAYVQDPSAQSGTSLLALNSGVERINLQSGTSEWLISDEDFFSYGIFSPIDFGLNSAGDTLYLSAWNSDWSGADIWRFDVASGEGEIVLSDLAMSERALEVHNDTLWIGSTKSGEEGIYVYDISEGEPVLSAGPLDLGLPPYQMLLID